jgi:hypothetical protein
MQGSEVGVLSWQQGNIINREMKSSANEAGNIYSSQKSTQD